MFTYEKIQNKANYLDYRELDGRAKHADFHARPDTAHWYLRKKRISEVFPCPFYNLSTRWRIRQQQVLAAYSNG